MLKDYKLVLLVSLVSCFQSNAMNRELLSSEPTAIKSSISLVESAPKKIYVILINPYITPPGEKLTSEDKKELIKSKIFPSEKNLVAQQLFELAYNGAISKIKRTYVQQNDKSSRVISRLREMGKQQNDSEWYKYHKLIGTIELTLRPKKEESVRKFVEVIFKGVPNIHSVIRDYGKIYEEFEKIKQINCKNTVNEDSESDVSDSIIIKADEEMKLNTQHNED